MVRGPAMSVLLLLSRGPVGSRNWMDKLRSAGELLDKAAKEATRD